jgi:hypothetical protein
MAESLKFLGCFLTFSRNWPRWLDPKVSPDSFRAIFEQAFQ